MHIENNSDYLPSSIKPVLLSASYKYNFYKRLSISSQLKFANGLKYQTLPAGYKGHFYSSLNLTFLFDFIKMKNLELNGGTGALATLFLYSYPIESVDLPYVARVRWTKKFGIPLTTNLKYKFKNNSFIAYSLCYEFYPTKYTLKMKTFSNQISFGVKF